MAKRILVPIAPDAPADYARAAVRAARIARKTGGIVRLAYLRPLPSPRVDRHDRVMADADREMERLSAHAEAHLAALAADMDGVPVETVIRFGDPGGELSIEAEVFHADLIALASPLHARMRGRFRAWRLQRAAVASKVPRDAPAHARGRCGRSREERGGGARAPVAEGRRGFDLPWSLWQYLRHHDLGRSRPDQKEGCP